MQYQITYEGQTIPVPAEIAADEQKLRRGLSSIIPGIAEAKIETTEKDGVTTISIVKTAGTKGNALQHLIGCQGGVNPTILCYESLQGIDFAAMTAEEIIEVDQRIDAAIEEGKEQRSNVVQAFRRLANSAVIPSPFVPLGF